MTPEERRIFAEMVAARLSADSVNGADALAEDLVRSGVVGELCDDRWAIAELFAAHGRHLGSSRLLDVVLFRPTDLAGLPALVFPGLGSAEAPGTVKRPGVVLDGLVRGEGTGPLVVATDADELYLVERAAIAIEPIHGIDPSLGLRRVTGVVPRAACQPVVGPQSWQRLSTIAVRAVAAELLGVASGALGLALRHVQQREQFGRPIASFQAVRHRLVDAHVAKVGATELLAASHAWADPQLEVALVKGAAGRAALVTVAAAQQVCGAMGFTAEFGLHRFVRRAMTLDSLFGGSEPAEDDLGILATAGRDAVGLVDLLGLLDG